MTEVGESPEGELERILNEKLYIRKNNALRDKSNTLESKTKPSFVNQDSILKKDTEFKAEEITSLPFPGKSEDKYVLEDLENDIDLKDVLQTKENILNNVDHPFNSRDSYDHLEVKDEVMYNQNLYDGIAYKKLMDRYLETNIDVSQQDYYSNRPVKDQYAELEEKENISGKNVESSNGLPNSLDLRESNNITDINTSNNYTGVKINDNADSRVIESTSNRNQVKLDSQSQKDDIPNQLLVDASSNINGSNKEKSISSINNSKKAKIEDNSYIKDSSARVSFSENANVLILDRSENSAISQMDRQRDNDGLKNFINKNETKDFLINDRRVADKNTNDVILEKRNVLQDEYLSKSPRRRDGKEIDVEGVKNYRLDKIKQLEREFNILIKTNKDTLQLKSKLHKFIYTEIETINREYIDKVNALESENKRLKREVDELNNTIKETTVSFERFKEHVRSNVLSWKRQVENYVREYVKKLKFNKN